MGALLRSIVAGSYESAAGEFHPGRLWSLQNMLESHARKYVKLGDDIANARLTFGFVETGFQTALKDEDVLRLHGYMKTMRDLCAELGLSISSNILGKRLGSIPRTSGELEVIIDAIQSELSDRLFLFVPPHRAKYYEIVFQSIISSNFPMVTKELVASGNALAAALYTASVFHSMRAAEIGMRCLGKVLNVSFPNKPIELADWHNILEQADSKIAEMKKLPSGAAKDEELKFYSQAAVQFRYFKDAWRVRVSHARETYEERAAIRVFDHTVEFFEVLSTRLSEPRPSPDDVF
jgi:hypothetical protein